MKNVLVISGSPRKRGNTMGIVKMLEDLIKKQDENVEFNYLYLIDKQLKWCRGCWHLNCLNKGGTFCPLKDDSAAIKKEIDSADGLIFASPCYAHQVSALFKNFMDRFMYLDHLPEYIDIPALVVVTTETDGATGVAKYINTMHALPWGLNVVGKIGVFHTFYKTNEKYHAKIVKKIGTAKARFLQALYTEEPNNPTLMQYLCFLYNRDETILYQEVLPGRYEFWYNKGWLQSRYYYDVKIPLLYRLTGLLVSLALNSYAKKGIGKNHRRRLAKYYKGK